jgi:hypothetical protein
VPLRKRPKRRRSPRIRLMSPEPFAQKYDFSPPPLKSSKGMTTTPLPPALKCLGNRHSGAVCPIQEQPVKRTILIFGLISGLISSVMMIATVPFADRLGHSYVLGYATIVLSLLLVFFGVRSYRDNVAQGHITFGRAFLVGLGITVISCLFYVVTWEVIYFNFMPDFMDKYGAHILQKMQAAGATAAAIQQKTEEINKLKEKAPSQTAVAVP